MPSLSVSDPKTVHNLVIGLYHLADLIVTSGKLSFHWSSLMIFTLCSSVAELADRIKGEMAGTPCCHHQINEPASRQVLGLTKKTWRLEHMRRILSHYNVPYCKRGTKDDLLRSLEQLAWARGLTFEDRRKLLRVLPTRSSISPFRKRRLIAVMVPPLRPPIVTSNMRPIAPEKEQMKKTPEVVVLDDSEPESHENPVHCFKQRPNIIILDDSDEEPEAKEAQDAASQDRVAMENMVKAFFEWHPELCPKCRSTTVRKGVEENISCNNSRTAA